MDLSFLVDEGLEQLPAFATSLAIGLLIGLERERRPEAKAGLRTFALVSLFGTLSAMLSEKTGSPWILAVALLATGLMIIAAYFQDDAAQTRSGHHDRRRGAGRATCLGAVVWFGHAKLAVMLAIVTTILLYFKTELKGLTERLTRTRSRFDSAVRGALLHRAADSARTGTIGPYDALNPHQVWLMVVLISGVSLAGYIALRLVGPRHGAPLLGRARRTRIEHRHHLGLCAPRPRPGRHAAARAVVILLANLVVLVRLGVLTAFAAPGVLPALLPVLGAAALADRLRSYAAALARHWTGGGTPMPEIDESDRDPHGARLRRRSTRSCCCSRRG